MELSVDVKPSPWPLTSLAGVDIGSPFDDEVAKRLGVNQVIELEPILEFDMAEEWTGERDSQYFGVDVFEGRVVGVSCHGDVQVHGRQLIGLTFDELVEAIGEPFEDDMNEGFGCCDYEDGELNLTIGIFEGKVSWASLHDYSYIEEEEGEPGSGAD